VKLLLQVVPEAAPLARRTRTVSRGASYLLLDHVPAFTSRDVGCHARELEAGRGLVAPLAYGRQASAGGHWQRRRACSFSSWWSLSKNS
jgi:hypothetical protein